MALKAISGFCQFVILLTLSSVLLIESGVSAAADLTYRPLVTLLTLVGPVAPPESQYISRGLTVNQSIPDNNSAGITSDAITNDYLGGSCDVIFGVKVSVGINHPRPADLVISLSTVSSDGSDILKTVTLFDGPALASDPSPQIPASFDAKDLVHSGECTRFRLTVADVTATNTGTLVSWTLDRRIGFYPYVHDPAY
jgi:subtilisin-like proprotein convertase family protein